MNYSKGISWIDDCRIPFVDEKNPSTERYKYSRNQMKYLYAGYNPTEYKEYTSQGRFPANLLCSDDILNDGCISESGKYKGEGTNSRYYDIDKWFNKMIDELL